MQSENSNAVNKLRSCENSLYKHLDNIIVNKKILIFDKTDDLLSLECSLTSF